MLPWLDKVPAEITVQKVQNVVCSDKKSECPDNTTCCQMQSGAYACCPLPNVGISVEKTDSYN